LLNLRYRTDCLGTPTLANRPKVRRQCDRGNDRNDRHDDHQFDQREPARAALSVTSAWKSEVLSHGHHCEVFTRR
jgi:hypothetical protein